MAARLSPAVLTFVVGIEAATALASCRSHASRVVREQTDSGSSRSKLEVCDPKANPDLVGFVVDADQDKPLNGKPVLQRTLLHGLQLRITENDDSARVELVRANHTWLAASGFRYSIDNELRGARGVPIGDQDGDGEPDGVAEEVPIVDRDINGDGKPELVLRSWSGGAHCCYVLHVLQTGPTPCLIDRLGADHVGYLTDIDADGVLEFVNHDSAWHGFHTHYTWQLEPELIHRYQDGRWRLAGALMRKPPPTANQMDGWLKTIREGRFEGIECVPEVCVLRAMLRLHYSGHPELSWQYFARVGDELEKESFKQEFERRLAASEAWTELGW